MIQTTFLEGKYKTQEKTVDIDLIVPNKWNPNVQSEEMFHKEIASIKEFGMIDPILVRDVAGCYQIIDGEHRWKACKEIGYREIKILTIGEVPDDEAKFLTLQMNNLRGKDEILKRAELLKSLSDGQLQLLPFTKNEIDFEIKLLEFDFSKFDKVDIDEKEKDPLKEIYNHLARAYILLEKIHEESSNGSIRLFAEKFKEVFESFKTFVD